MLAEPPRPELEYIKQHMSASTWGGSICEITGLRKLVLEFEIDERKKSQLDTVVERAKGWIFPLSKENFVLEWDGQLAASSWEGVRDLKDDLHFLKEQPVPADLPTRGYNVIAMVWNAREATSSTQ